MPFTHRPSRGWARPGRGRGFTLIELMITVAIIGILAAVALPAYEGSVKKGKRAQGRTALLEAMQAQERYFTQMNTYLDIPTAGDSTTIKMTSGDIASSPAYKLQAVLCGGAGVTFRDCVQLIAIPQYPFSDPEAANLTLTSTGAKGCSGTKSATPGFCWP